MTIPEIIQVITVENSAVDPVDLDPEPKKQRLTATGLDGVESDSIEEVDDEIQDEGDAESSHEKDTGLSVHGMVMLPMPVEEAETAEIEQDETGSTPCSENEAQPDEVADTLIEEGLGEENVSDDCEVVVLEVDNDDTNEESSDKESASGSCVNQEIQK
jgi:hypothetical protein